MRRISTLVVAAHLCLATASSAQEPRDEAAAPSGDTWTRSVADPSKRDTLHGAFQKVRGDSGKWNDAPQAIHAPPRGERQAKTSLDTWMEQVMEQDFQLTPQHDNWVLLRTRQLDDNDRVWVERIERRGDQFTLVVSEAVWQGRYGKNFTYYNVIGANLGKLPPGEYRVRCILKSLVFSRFAGNGRPRDPQRRENASTDERPAGTRPVELQLTFRVAAKG